MNKSISNLHFDQGLALGLFISYISAGTVYTLCRTTALEPDHFATYSAGAVALLAAFFTVRAIRQQTLSEQERHEEIQKNRYRASRSSLALTLNSFFDVLSKSCDQILYPQKNFKVNIDAISKTCDRITACIEVADEESANELGLMVSRVQIVLARHQALLESEALVLADEEDDSLTVDGIMTSRISPVLDILHLRHSALELFKFARLEESNFAFLSASAAELEGALKFLKPSRTIENHSLHPELIRQARIFYGDPINSKGPLDY